MSAPNNSSPHTVLPEALRERLLERFCHYVTFDTSSELTSTTYPSTAGQLDLLRHLAEQLQSLGAAEVVMGEHGYVTAILPGQGDLADAPTIGLLAHVDTSSEVSGSGVRPLVHENWSGQDILLPDDPSIVLSSDDDPALAAEVGRTFVTASGTTLLGADDKAGVAILMTIAEACLRSQELAAEGGPLAELFAGPRAPLRLAFTPDEEIGRGVQHFDAEAFGADFAYTLDGGPAGELEIETFCAASAVLTFRGVNTHPGYAKGQLVNAVKVAGDFLQRLPADALSPETTEGKEGFVHPNAIRGNVASTTVRLLLRDFRLTALETQRHTLETLAQAAVDANPGSSYTLTVEETYRNMREVLDRHPHVADLARRALREADLEPLEHPIRGGTDGARLSFMGIPTPNLFSGQHNIHSVREWASLWEMEKAVEVVLRIARGAVG
ncbi:MAG: peptidase T [Acidobacteriota bacterium]